LVRALGLAHYWQWLLDNGRYRSITEIAAVEGIDRGQASRIVQQTRLAPDIVEDRLAGEAMNLALEHVIRRAIAVSWDEQRKQLRHQM